MAKTVLGIGAHYDDCIFGIPGVLLHAVRKNHRVVILSLIGDYSNWKPAVGREREICEGTVRISKEYGVEHRLLNFASMRYDVNQETKRAVAAAVAEIEPDIAFMLWPQDRHSDHEVASKLSTIALRHGDRLHKPEAAHHQASRIYEYDNGPRHTIGFEPDTYVDITDDWPQAIAWLGKLMSLVRGKPYDPEVLDSAQRAKESLARYRGQTCGVPFAEALRAGNAYPQEIL